MKIKMIVRIAWCQPPSLIDRMTITSNHVMICDFVQCPTCQEFYDCSPTPTPTHDHDCLPLPVPGWLEDLD